MNPTDVCEQVARGAIIGAGAQGRITAVIWRRAEPARKLLFLDDNSELWGTAVLGISVSGAVESLANSDASALAVIVAVGNNYARTTIARRLEERGIVFANVVDPTAVTMLHAQLGKGVFIGPQAVVHTGAKVGDHVVINTGAMVEHDCVLETGVSLSPGVHMGGRVYLEKHAFVCTGATLIGRIRIGEGAIVGAGSVVIDDVAPGSLVYGCPAKVVRKATEDDWNRLF